MLDFVCKETYDLSDYIALLAFLRSEAGCPWDREQTHESIRRNMLEEAYETVEAIDEGDMPHLREELGDLLMQVLFHAQMESEKGGFDINSVADAACKKLVHRHPHVFGAAAAETAEQVLDTWESVKRSDRKQESVASVMDGVSRAQPSLWRAEKVQKKAAKQGFDWPNAVGALDKLTEEVQELQAGAAAGDAANIEEELGDVLFSAVNVCRFYSLDPETVLHKACDKFIRRFRYVEEGARSASKELRSLSLSQQEGLYQQGRHELEGKEPLPVKP